MQLEGIKNIIFDLGAVIINIDPSKAKQALRELFPCNFLAIEKEAEVKEIFNQLETGKCSTEEFVRFFNSYDTTLAMEQIIAAWNSMLLDIPKERIALIEQLSKNYRVFLLSNTNQIHLNFIDAYVVKAFNLKGMAALFEKAHYSHQMGMRKPNLPIFKQVLAENKLVASQTLFIDDAKEHIQSAQRLNIATHHLLPTETITDLFL